jgi:hypothetical protein
VLVVCSLNRWGGPLRARHTITCRITYETNTWVHCPVQSESVLVKPSTFSINSNPATGFHTAAQTR